MTQPSQYSLQLLFAWVITNFIGGFILGFLETNGSEFMATLILSGAIIGPLQWLCLRWIAGKRRLPWLLWPLASAIGWIISTLVSIVTLPVSDAVVSLVTQFGLWEVFWLNLLLRPIELLGMALAQGFILSYRTRLKVQIVGVWVLASCLGGALHGAVSASLCLAYCAVLPSALTGLIYGAGWAVYGFVTGIALVWVLKQTAVKQDAAAHQSLS